MGQQIAAFTLFIFWLILHLCEDLRRNWYCQKSRGSFSPYRPLIDSSWSYYINTSNHTKILDTRLYHIIISVGDVSGILFLLSLRCLFVLHMQQSWPLKCTTFQQGICHSISSFGRNITLTFILETIGFGFGTRRIGLLASYCRNVISASTTDAKNVEKEDSRYQSVVSVGS